MKPTLESARTKPSRFLVIGNGRWATHLKYYLQILNLSFTDWNRRRPLGELPQLLSECTHVLLAISDSFLVDFFQQHLRDFSGPVVHFSGALEIPGIHGVHPLMSFGPELYNEEVYRSLPLVTTSAKTLNELLPGFPNELYRLEAKDKAYYHALCVLGGNLTTILVKKMVDGFAELDLPKELGQAYLRQVITNVFHRPETALTGPLARKDFVTIEKNLSSLQQRDPAFAKVYQAFIPTAIKELQKENQPEVQNENPRL